MTASAAAVAIAASRAFPPACRIARPASEASACGAATMPREARTSSPDGVTPPCYNAIAAPPSFYDAATTLNARRLPSVQAEAALETRTAQRPAPHAERQRHQQRGEDGERRELAMQRADRRALEDGQLQRPHRVCDRIQLGDRLQPARKHGDGEEH